MIALIDNDGGDLIPNRKNEQYWLVVAEIGDGWYGWCLKSKDAVKMFVGYTNAGVKVRFASLRDTKAREWCQLTFGWVAGSIA